MIIIGDGLCNTIRSEISDAMRRRDTDFFKRLTKQIDESGAHYIRVIGTGAEKAGERLEWLINLVQEVTDKPLSICCSDMDQVALGMKLAHKPGIIRYRTYTIRDVEVPAMVYPLLVDNDWKVMVAPVNDDGKVPADAKEMAEKGVALIQNAGKYGIDPERIFMEYVQGQFVIIGRLR